MDFKDILSKFVITINMLLLWEKVIKNQEEVKSMLEAMEKEDQGKLQNLL